MTTTVSVADLRKGLGPVLEEAHHSLPVMISKRDKNYASVVSHEEGELITEMHEVAKELGVDVSVLRSTFREMLSDPDQLRKKVRPTPDDKAA
ncbi:hypothetical protein [uncultured Roseobacter sp.]|uniref:hypothetical protein n=1 Tax=uncultured Roseobacter sp. TaxID=114847 RepID=UPI002625AA41|nr:hypothetical protein [uncultured Roseobacter sp.]